MDEAIKLMDFSIRSLRTLKSDNSKNAETKSRMAGRDIKNQDRMTEVVKAVRQVIQESGSISLKIGEIAKVLAKKHVLSIGIDRDELTAVLAHYHKLQIIQVDQEENVVFL